MTGRALAAIVALSASGVGCDAVLGLDALHPPAGDAAPGASSGTKGASDKDSGRADAAIADSSLATGASGSGATSGAASGTAGSGAAAGASSGASGLTGASGGASGTGSSLTDASVTGSDASGSPGTLTDATTNGTDSPNDASSMRNDASVTNAEAGMYAGCDPGATIVVMMPMSGSEACGNADNLGGNVPVCLVLHGSIPMSWSGANTTGCSITVTGGGPTQSIAGAAADAKAQPAMPAGPDGNVYWNLTAGCVSYAAIFCY